MYKGNNRNATKWLALILMILCLTFFKGQSVNAQEYMLGDIPLHPDIYQKHMKVMRLDMTAEALPEVYDARDEGIVTEAKSQGFCGSCWAFACIAAMESHLLKAYGFGPTDLSEQQQVSCNLNMSGCCGGSSAALRYWEDKGPNYEGCFPYGESDTSCSTAQRTVECLESAGCEQLSYRVVDWHTVPVTQNDFKTSLYTYGPSYWRFNVYRDFDDFWSYGNSGDVYVSQPGYEFRGGHAVLLIGWDDIKGAYLCKNSWGATGGPNGDGTFWIAYTGHAQSMGFGMSNFSLAAVGCGNGTCEGSEDPCNCPADCGPPQGAEEPNATCADGLDNDCDGSVDCDDSDCENDPACLCGNGACETNEGPCDCPADCGPPALREEPGNTCADGLDNDCDGSVDCDDRDCVGDPECPCGNGMCEEGEDCHSCPEDCIGGQGGECGACFKGACNGECHPKKEGPDCADCAPTYCCGDGFCEGAEDSYNCMVDCGPPPLCGDGICESDEDQCFCPEDCGAPPSTEFNCSNGIDDDCDGSTDCNDNTDCADDPACFCLSKGSKCSADSECCSNKCRGGKCR